jgi:predicted MFS family arabinose efflux permease
VTAAPTLAGTHPFRLASRLALLRLGVGVALADSSIVTLALPNILGRFDVGITTVAWVLTSFNLVLMLAALPCAYAARRSPNRAFAAGAVVFALASLACGLAPAFAVLLAARCVQAVGAALLVVAALDLLAEVTHDRTQAIRNWVAAGVVGAAVGPAAGGILTELLGWRAIFLVQVPIGVLLLAAVGRGGAPAAAVSSRRPRVTPNLALLLLSGGLVAALFLLVLLLVTGWRMSPAAAGVVVSVLPVAALLSGRFVPSCTGLRVRIASGVVLVAGGLAALALLPRAGWAWTLVPQVLIGVGVGLALAALTEQALEGRGDVVHGGWTLAARHAGVVLGLLLLAPLLTSALERNKDQAIRAGTAEVLDSRIPPLDKLGVAQDVLREVDVAKSEGKLPDVGTVFADRPSNDEYRALAAALENELDRAVTNAFSRPFALAALLALAALIPVALGRWERS